MLKVILEFFNLVYILKKQKRVIGIPLLNYGLNSGKNFSRQRILCRHKKILAKVGPSGERIATQLFSLRKIS